MRDSISTSPKAMQAFLMIKWLDPLVGPAEAQSFMLSANENLPAGETPVAAIKEGRILDVERAVKCLAAEKGIFDAPWLPPEPPKRT
jgi:hypothetical protein